MRLVAMLVLVHLLLTGCATQPADAAITMRLNTGMPPSHHLTKNVWGPWAERVARETGGRVRVEIFHADTLGSLDTAVQDLRGGVYDAGTVVPNYFEDSSLFPLTVTGLAGSYPDISTGNRVLGEFAARHAGQVRIDGIATAAPSVSDPYLLFSTRPITSVDDLRGLLVKVQGPSEQALVESWGGNPVQIATSETYQALERGTIDVAPYTLVGNAGAKFHEVAPFVTALDSGGTVSMPAVAGRFLDRLPPDLRDVFDERLLPGLSELNLRTYALELDRARTQLAQDAPDVRFVDLVPAERERFRAGAREQWTRWAGRAADRGLDGDALVGEWKALLGDAGAGPPF